MRLFKDLALGLAAFVIVLLGLVAVLVARTLSFTPRAGAPQPVALAAPVTLDMPAAARHLGEAIRFQTVSHQDPRENDGKAWEDQRAWLAATYPHFHAVAERELIGDGVLVYTWKGSDPGLQPIVLMAHQDVVPVSAGTEGQWKAPPFSGALQDGAVWGRGAIDDKGSLIALMEAADAVAAQGFRPKRTIIVVSGNHEEVAGGQIGKAVQLLASRKVRALYILDEGLGLVDDIPGIPGSTALIGVAEKGYGTLRITAKGQGGHSSIPPANTAVVSLAKAVVAISAKPFPLTLKGPTKDMLESFADRSPFGTRLALANAWLFGPLITAKMGATPSGAAELHTTMAPTMLEGSPKENVLPETATARINYRIYPGETTADVMARARSAVNGLPVALDWDGAPSEPSKVASSDNLGYRAIASLAMDMGRYRAAPALMVGATDSRFLAPLSDNIYKFEFIHLSQQTISQIHGTNEHMTLDNLARLTQFFARLIKTTAG